MIGPGAGRIDHAAGAQHLAIGEAHHPGDTVMTGIDQCNATAQLAVLMAQAAKKDLVQRVDVDVLRVAFVQRAVDELGPQTAHALQGGVDTQHLEVGADGRELVAGLGEQRILSAGRQVHDATRRQQALGRQTARRLFVEAATRAGQRAHRGRAITFDEHRRRTPRGVVAGLPTRIREPPRCAAPPAATRATRRQCRPRIPRHRIRSSAGYTNLRCA